jgi:carbon monoxide dehydrogenase subunit G
VAQVEYSATAKLPVPVIWDFVREMDNWATFVSGYQSHAKQSETESLWTLKGDLGVMARTLNLRVEVLEWAGPERVRFTMQGLNEPMQGSGSFELTRYEEAIAAPAPAPKRSLWQRGLDALARFFYHLVHGRVERATPPEAGPGEGMTRLTFRLEIRPGGPMAPMIDAMIRPLLAPAAEGLAERILKTLEDRAGSEVR